MNVFKALTCILCGEFTETEIKLVWIFISTIFPIHYPLEMVVNVSGISIWCVVCGMWHMALLLDTRKLLRWSFSAKVFWPVVKETTNQCDTFDSIICYIHIGNSRRASLEDWHLCLYMRKSKQHRWKFINAWIFIRQHPTNSAYLPYENGSLNWIWWKRRKWKKNSLFTWYWSTNAHTRKTYKI